MFHEFKSNETKCDWSGFFPINLSNYVCYVKEKKYIELDINENLFIYLTNYTFFYLMWTKYLVWVLKLPKKKVIRVEN